MLVVFRAKTNARADRTGRAAAADAPAPNKNARDGPKRLLCGQQDPRYARITRYAHVNTYLAGTDDCQTGTGPGFQTEQRSRSGTSASY